MALLEDGVFSGVVAVVAGSLFGHSSVDLHSVCPLAGTPLTALVGGLHLGKSGQPLPLTVNSFCHKAAVFVWTVLPQWGDHSLDCRDGWFSCLTVRVLLKSWGGGHVMLGPGDW